MPEATAHPSILPQENPEDVPYDAFLLVSFGGPEGPEDVLPFLENVLRGKPVPRERMLEVAEHYQQFGGISPINEQCRALMAALRQEFDRHAIKLPIYWGNRNWHPLLEDTLRTMKDSGHRRCLAFFTSMFSCYSGCRQYRENIQGAREKVGDQAPTVDKLRMGYNHPGFIEPQVELLKGVWDGWDAPRRERTPVLFCAHSIPLSMAEHSRYVEQLQEASRLVAERAAIHRWEVVFQSRSGSPHQPWLEPDVCDRIEAMSQEERLDDIILVPLGFVSDHMEVIYDLDTEAATLCREKGIGFHRVATVGTHPRFVSMIRELVLERLHPDSPRQALGSFGPSHDRCPANCCLYPVGPRPRP